MSFNAQTGDVLEEVLKERERQDAKWGEQNHPSLSLEIAGYKLERVHEEMGVPMAHTARARVENLAKRGTLGYADIALEEFAEAIEAAALGDTENLRIELVQTAAVLVAWIERLDRRRTCGVEWLCWGCAAGSFMRGCGRPFR